MILAETLEHARPERTETYDQETFVGQVVRLIVPKEASCAAPRPEAFLVEQIPHWSLRTHFHLQHQFQLFVAGGGWLGRQAIPPLTVHYATAHSAYGPLRADERGISYLTMRVLSDRGAWYMPEARPKLRTDLRKRQVHAHPSCQRTGEELRMLAEVEQETLIPLGEDGLGAWMYRLPPHAQSPAPPGAQLGAGRFIVVTQGSVKFPCGEQRGLATAFASPDDAFGLEAGADGAEVVVLQFPSAALTWDSGAGQDAAAGG